MLQFITSCCSYEMKGNTIERLMTLLYERVNVVEFGSYKDLMSPE